MSNIMSMLNIVMSLHSSVCSFPEIKALFDIVNYFVDRILSFVKEVNLFAKIYQAALTFLY